MLESIDNIVASLVSNTLKEHLHNNLELKEDWTQAHGAKLSALANKAGKNMRWLVVGVDDKGQQVKRDEKWAIKNEEVISQHCNMLLDPNQACTGIYPREVNGSWIIIVGMKNPGDVVYWGDDAYKATGTTVKPMSPEETLKLRIQLPGLTDYSVQEIGSVYNDNLVNLFGKYVSQKGHLTEYSTSSKEDGHEVLKKLGMDGRQVARILFGDASYRIVKYDKYGEPIENKKNQGLFNVLTNEFADEIQKWTKKESGNSSEAYPSRALKEALANAVAHAAYFENDGEIIIELHPKSITISNLCIRESTYFANRWFSRSHKTINPLLMEVLRISGLVDELGRGKNLIFSESIKHGKRPPIVIIERAGKFDRWKLTLFGKDEDENILRLLERSRTVYADEQKALIAQALVLWRHKPVSEIRNFIDGDFSRQFAEVLSSLEGPIFYWKDKDQIILRRWASVLIGEGKDSKAFSPAEEARLRAHAYDMQTKFQDGHITPKDLRRLAAMLDTASEATLSSKMLQKWEKDGIVKLISKGKYKFIEHKPKEQPAEITQLLKLFKTED